MPGCHTTATETTQHNWGVRAEQRKIPRDATKVLHATTKTQHSQLNKYL